MIERTRQRGSASEFHARPLDDPVRPAVWAFEVDAPALVLGSTQSPDVVDAAACAAAGVEVVKRRSGGGAVLVAPGEMVWFDVIVPVEWLHRAGVGDDVGRSMVWLGGLVDEALGDVGHAGPRTVHDGAMVCSRWSRLVCFDGIGPGEVLTPAGKLVGISQRRTRDAARFQCAVHTVWSPQVLVALLAAPAPDAAELAPVDVLAIDVARALPDAVADRLDGQASLGAITPS